jgi:hypothetical protein
MLRYWGPMPWLVNYLIPLFKNVTAKHCCDRAVVR